MWLVTRLMAPPYPLRAGGDPPAPRTLRRGSAAGGDAHVRAGLVQDRKHVVRQQVAAGWSAGRPVARDTVQEVFADQAIGRTPETVVLLDHLVHETRRPIGTDLAAELVLGDPEVDPIPLRPGVQEPEVQVVVEDRRSGAERHQAAVIGEEVVAVVMPFG